jgi:hypothetical protein
LPLPFCGFNVSFLAAIISSRRIRKQGRKENPSQ